MSAGGLRVRLATMFGNVIHSSKLRRSCGTDSAGRSRPDPEILVRILYIDINASFQNPTRSLVPLALMRAVETRLFGPGHVDPDTLRGGLHAFLAVEGPFDLCVTNSHVLFADVYDAAPDPAQVEAMIDQIRQRLTALNVTLEDRPGGTNWRLS